MRVAVWGAGAIGSAAAYRLTVSPYVSEVHWINRTYDKIRYRVVDIQHGLAFAPSCHPVKGYGQKRAHRALAESDLVVLTLGASVPSGAGREAVLEQNRRCFDEAVISLLGGYEGTVLVVTNPVDLMALHVQRSAAIDVRRCLGLGTVVETARLRASLAKHMSPMRPAREMLAYAIGTHDDHVVVVTRGAASLGRHEVAPAIVEMARLETVKAAARVKQDDRSTLHPVVEGIVAVVEAIASDREEVLTVSSFDPNEDLFYSLPCTLGTSGVVHRHDELTGSSSVSEQLARGLEELRKLTGGSENTG